MYVATSLGNIGPKTLITCIPSAINLETDHYMYSVSLLWYQNSTIWGEGWGGVG